MSRMPPENQSEARRIERMASAYKLLEPSELEIATRRRQALPKAFARRSSFGRGLIWAGALVLVTGGALAGGGWALGVLGVLGQSRDFSAAAQGSVNEPAPRVVPRSPSATPSSSVTELEAVPAPAPTAHVVQAHAAAPEQRPASVRSELAERREAESWKAVADAMRSDDTPRAREALDKLSASEDASTRNAADLARAKLDVARGDLASARAVFERIAREGKTPQLKAQATRALRQLEGK